MLLLMLTSVTNIISLLYMYVHVNIYIYTYTILLYSNTCKTLYLYLYTTSYRNKYIISKQIHHIYRILAGIIPNYPPATSFSLVRYYDLSTYIYIYIHAYTQNINTVIFSDITILWMEENLYHLVDDLPQCSL